MRIANHSFYYLKADWKNYMVVVVGMVANLGPDSCCIVDCNHYCCFEGEIRWKK